MQRHKVHWAFKKLKKYAMQCSSLTVHSKKKLPLSVGWNTQVTRIVDSLRNLIPIKRRPSRQNIINQIDDVRSWESNKNYTNICIHTQKITSLNFMIFFRISVSKSQKRSVSDYVHQSTQRRNIRLSLLWTYDMKAYWNRREHYEAPP